MADDGARKAILARRARFMAAALLGAGLVDCDRKNPEQGGQPSPQPPSSASAQPVEDNPVVPPQPCLSPPADVPSALPDAGTRPHVCLSPVRQKPKPMVCLSFSAD